MKKLLLTLAALSSFAYADTGTIPLSSNFNVGSGVPLDGRITVSDTTARDAISGSVRYRGLTVFCRSDNHTYQLQGSTATWVDITSSSGGVANTGRWTFYNSSAVVTNSGSSSAPLLTMSVSDLTNNPSMQVMTSTGTGYPLKITNYGRPSGGLQTLDGGVINVTNIGQPAPSLVLVDSTSDIQQGSGVIELWSQSNAHNDPLIWVHRNSYNSSPEMRWDSPSPNMEMVTTSTDNAHGRGKFEPFATPYQGEILQVNSRAWDNSTFENIAYWEPLDIQPSVASPGLFLRSQTLDNDSGILTSSNTLGVNFFSQNGHTIGITGPLNVASGSWRYRLPAKATISGQMLFGLPTDSFGDRPMDFTVGGSSGQVMTNGGTGAPYWSSVSGGAANTGRWSFYTSSAVVTNSGSSSSPLLNMSVTDTTNNPTAAVITSSGTGNGLTITNYGQPSGAVQTLTGGALNVSNFGLPSPSLVIVDSVTEVQTGEGLVELWEEASGHNDPLIWIHNKSSNSAPYMRTDDPQPDEEIVCTSTDNPHGLGKWEPHSVPFNGTQLQVNSRAGDNSTFERVAEWRPRSKGTALALYPTNNGENGDWGPTGAAQIIWLTTATDHEIGLRGPSSTSASWYWTLPNTANNIGNVLYQSSNAPDRNLAFTADGTSDGQCLTWHAGGAPTWGSCGGASGGTYSIQYRDASGAGAGSGFYVDINQQALLVGTTTGAEGKIELQEASANGSSYVGFASSPSLSGSTTWILPAQDGSAGDVLTTNGSAGGHSLSWTTPSAGGGGSPGGSSYTLQYKSGSSTFGGANDITYNTATNGLRLGTTTQIEFYQADNSHYVGFRAQNTGMAGSITWQLPVQDGTTGQVLTTGGSGNSHSLYWSTPATGSGSGVSVYPATATASFPYGFSATTATYTGTAAFTGSGAISLSGTSALGQPLIISTLTAGGFNSGIVKGSSGDSYLNMVNNSSFTPILNGGDQNDTFSRYVLSSAGAMQWGPGSASQDLWLYRSGSSQLTLDSNGVGGTGATVIFPGTISSTGGLSHGTRSVVTGNYSAVNTDSVILASTTINSVTTVTLPSAAANPGMELSIWKVDSDTGAVVINAFSGETIQGTGTITLYSIHQGGHLQANAAGLWEPMGAFYTNPPYTGIPPVSLGTAVVPSASSSTYVSPFYNTNPVMVCGYRLRVSTSGGSNGAMNLGVWDGNTGTLINSTGPVSNTSTGFKTFTVPPFFLNAGYPYLIGYQPNNTVVALNPWTNALATIVGSFSQTGTSMTLPSPITFGSTAGSSAAITLLPCGAPWSL